MPLAAEARVGLQQVPLTSTVRTEADGLRACIYGQAAPVAYAAVHLQAFPLVAERVRQDARNVESLSVAALLRGTKFRVQQLQDDARLQAAAELAAIEDKLQAAQSTVARDGVSALLTSEKAMGHLLTVSTIMLLGALDPVRVRDEVSRTVG